MIRLLIIDGLNLMRRIYSALPVAENNSPEIAHYVDVCDKTIHKIIVQHRPSHAVCVIEHHSDTWRHRLYPPYKANRKPQPAAMLESFAQIRERIARLNIGWLDIEGYEADDIIASIVHTTREYDCRNLVLSSDRLMAQLLDDKTSLFDHFKGLPIDAMDIRERYGIRPQQLPDFFALCGSSSVNVPGIAGIGRKTAASLLVKYGDCDRLIEAQSLPLKVAKKLEGAANTLYLYRALFTLRLDCPIHGNLKQWRLDPVET